MADPALTHCCFVFLRVLCDFLAAVRAFQSSFPQPSLWSHSLFHLCREDMRNSFNFLLIALICMDSSYLIGWIIEAFRKSFHVSGRKEAAQPLGSGDRP